MESRTSQNTLPDRTTTDSLVSVTLTDPARFSAAYHQLAPEEQQKDEAIEDDTAQEDEDEEARIQIYKRAKHGLYG